MVLHCRHIACIVQDLFLINGNLVIVSDFNILLIKNISIFKEPLYNKT